MLRVIVSFVVEQLLFVRRFSAQLAEDMMAAT